jgi:sporulation protein YlmC with PRC-barrel domain
MTHYGTLRDFRFVDKDADDVRGATVYNVHNDKLGKIDNVIFDHSTGNIRYAVIDTGGWLSSKNFIVPPDRLRESANHEGDFMTGLTKQQIEAFPAYNEKDLESEDKWNDYENRYRSKWVGDPIMHRAETDRNITPTTAQMTQGTGATGSLNWERGSQSGTTGRRSEMAAAPDESMTGTERIIPPTANEVTISNSAAGIGGRWLTFESRLRQHPPGRHPELRNLQRGAGRGSRRRRGR